MKLNFGARTRNRTKDTGIFKTRAKYWLLFIHLFCVNTKKIFRTVFLLKFVDKSASYA